VAQHPTVPTVSNESGSVGDEVVGAAEGATVGDADVGARVGWGDVGGAVDGAAEGAADIGERVGWGVGGGGPVVHASRPDCVSGEDSNPEAQVQAIATLGRLPVSVQIDGLSVIFSRESGSNVSGAFVLVICAANVPVAILNAAREQREREKQINTTRMSLLYLQWRMHATKPGARYVL
jgi:hypothetical protein